MESVSRGDCVVIGSPIRPSLCLELGVVGQVMQQQRGPRGPVRAPRFRAWDLASRSARSCHVVFLLVFVCISDYCVEVWFRGEPCLYFEKSSQF